MLENQKHLFSIPEGIHYLNCATMGPILKSVENEGIKAVTKKSTPWQITQETFFESINEVKPLCAKLVNVLVDRISLLPSVSYGMAIVAKNLPNKPNLKAGQHILMVQEEFPSDVYAWDEVCVNAGLRVRSIAPPDNPIDRGKVWNQRLITAINSETCMVVISPVHWADGTLFNLKAIAQACAKVGAWFVIDGTQSVGALPIDVTDIQPDALICGGYKWLLGPYSCGFAYWGSAFDTGQPLEQNWMNRIGSNDFKNLINYQSHYRPDAFRYNVGEQSNFILNPMLAASITQLLAWGVENIQEYCKNLVTEPIKKLREMGYWVENDSFRASHLFGIRLPESADISKIQMQLKANNVHVSFRGSAIRISPHLYNDSTDIDALLQSLAF